MLRFIVGVERLTVAEFVRIPCVFIGYGILANSTIY